MSIIETNNPIVITNEQIEKITHLIHCTNFMGVSDWEDESLFKYGWLYDNETNKIITTRKNYTWEWMNSPLKFRVFELDLSKIDSTYLSNQQLICEYNNFLCPWDELKLLDKLNYLEMFDSFLSSSNNYEEYSIDEIITFFDNIIIKKIENNKNK